MKGRKVDYFIIDLTKNNVSLEENSEKLKIHAMEEYNSIRDYN